MSLWQWYKGIPTRTRMLVGVGVMGYAAAAMFVTDRLEERMGLVPTEKDKEELDRALPKITVVDRPSKSSTPSSQVDAYSHRHETGLSLLEAHYHREIQQAPVHQGLLQTLTTFNSAFNESLVMPY
ncbi:hypothetical protein PMIN01_07097 [Paraphaeosphaeria minitans]|uniref:Uncharacterized protein n=1 Tax=Paraphaeosphaeria minitans TaxID=565426 RepID=A0A9P6GHD0_9PLEO|nr:hypothetical protein PMIN01_07097 [Paraphaeosphaeria minitans]